MFVFKLILLVKNIGQGDTVDSFNLEETGAVRRVLRSKLEAIRNSMVDLLVDNVAF